MQTSSIHLDAAVRIPVFELLRRVNDVLLHFLQSFTAEKEVNTTFGMKLNEYTIQREAAGIDGTSFLCR